MSTLSLDTIDDGFAVRDRLWPATDHGQCSIPRGVTAWIVPIDGVHTRFSEWNDDGLRDFATRWQGVAYLECAVADSKTTSCIDPPPETVLADLAGAESNGLPFLFDRRSVQQYRLWLFTSADDEPPNVPGVINVFESLKADGLLPQYRMREPQGLRRWRFPRPAYVWRLPNTAALLQRYTPDHQQRVVEVQLPSHTRRLAAARNFVLAAPTSPAGATIEQWWQRNSAAPIFGEPHRSFDADLSVLGTMVVRTLVEYDSLRSMHSSHKALLLAQLAATTPYRARVDSGNSLLLHVLLCGPAQNTKSFVLDELVALSIPGTVDVITRSTAAATDTDTPEVDRVKVMHEVPNEMLMAVPKSRKVPEVQVKWKSILTSGEAVTETFVLLAGGVRATRTAVSEKRFSLIGASNVDAREIDPAMRSRLIVLQTSEQANARADVAFEDKLLGEQTDRAVIAESTAFLSRSHRTQALIYFLENAIGAGVLHDVTLAVTSLVIRTYRRVMHFRFAISMSRRHLAQVKHVARQLVLRRTAYLLQHTVGNDLTKWHLALLDPWLRDDEECAYMALDLLAEQWLDPVHLALVQFLRWATSTAAHVMPRSVDANHVTLLISTVSVCKGVRRYCKEWHGLEATVFDVRRLVHSLCDRRIRAATYEWQKQLVGDAGARVARRTSVFSDVAPLQVLDKDGGQQLLVHRSWLDGDVNDLHECAIAACFNAYTPSAKFVSGRPISPRMPQLFGVRNVRPNEHVVEFQSDALSADTRLILQLPPPTAATIGDGPDQDDDDVVPVVISALPARDAALRFHHPLPPTPCLARLSVCSRLHLISSPKAPDCPRL
jgi:hypothetical protein